MSPLWVSYRSMASRFPPFAFVELVSPYNKKDITRWLEDMNFMFSWQEQYLTRSLRSLVRHCSCHSNIKFISSRHRVISSTYKHTSDVFLTIIRRFSNTFRRFPKILQKVSEGQTIVSEDYRRFLRKNRWRFDHTGTYLSTLEGIM